MTAVVRPLESKADEDAVRAIFRSTLMLGRPLRHAPIAMRSYEGLCLDWYLGEGRAEARVLADGADVLGYALVCVDDDAYAHWARARALRVGLRAAPAAVGSGFWRRRIRDAAVLRAAPHPASAHAHINLVPTARTGLGALSLCMAVDDICRSAGHTAWYGEVNAIAGRRAAALERVMGEIVHRAPNHTLTWMLGTPVERLTVLRRLERLAA